ncbi:MAG: hypothetical protein CME64_08760 [Halobacteriovoraceae bacterium]|nr:hypothetical protein [Halobacteriovoraceae bacterium]|tara:strand:+ start:36 stop:413 length:378 start_codon:yes stop_codon:yes gene_type:complete
MPILHVKALPQKDSSKIAPALKKTCRAIAEFYECKPEHVWATWEELRPGLYFEGENSVDNQPVNTHPPIATLTCFELDDPERIEKLLLIASKTLSEALGLGDNMFITYQKAKSGEVVSGNKIVHK